ncbi:MAG TPA: J domain-containing protein [Streptosporangiaceae bacterium]
MTNPFAALGLEPRADLTDDEVRAAWRRTASATHPDRDDGGDPRQFADAAAAYTVLRTRFGRGEAVTDLGGAHPGRRGSGRGSSVMDVVSAEGQGAARLLTRVRQGRPGRLALRVLAAVAASVAAVAAAGPHPAAPALVTGVATWLVLTARHDLAGPDR